VKTFRSIQYLRGIAALMVVLFHAFQWTHVSGLTATDFPTGAAGVDVFFVISGFVMWVTTDDRTPTPRAFLWRRAVRILPPYWAFTLMALGLAAAWPQVFQDVRGGAWNIALSLLLIPHFDPAGEAFPVLKPGWTLPYEALFYLVFAIGLLMEKRGRFFFVAIALTSIASVGFISPAASVLIANPLMFEFLAGMALAALWRAGKLGNLARGWSMITLAAAAYAALQAIDYRDYDWRPLFWGVPSALLVAGAVDVEAAGKLPQSRALKFCGDASYSIYLSHFLVLQALARVFGVGSAWTFIPEALIASIAVGLIARQVIEKPTIKWLRGVGRAMPGFETAQPASRGSQSG
jgi:exopolysaccharide production protein ExoZ